MRMTARSRPDGFSLIELLVVMAIIAIMAALTLMSLRGVNDSGRFNQSLNNIVGILDQSRAYASAQDTYVWVVFYQVTPPSGPPDVFVGSFASNDGTDPFNWSTSTTVTLPTPGTVGSTTLKPVMKFSHFKGLHLLPVTSTSPGAPTSPNLPATAATASNFQYTVPSDTGQVSLSNANPTYWVIEFTSSGGARNSANTISSIWLGLQPAYGATVFDQKNLASIEVNGLTGLSTIYRP